MPAHFLRWAAAGAFLMLATSACERTPPQKTTDASPATTAQSDARLRVAVGGAKIQYRGVVADAAARDELTRAIAWAYANGNATGKIDVVAGTRAPAWSAALSAFLAAFHAPKAAVEFQGRRIDLSGVIEDQKRIDLRILADKLYPGYTLTGLFDLSDLQAKLPPPERLDALVRHLNSLKIDFVEDSGLFTPESEASFKQAASSLKSTGTLLRINVGVYPEVTDMPEFDQRIAKMRADSVRVMLLTNGIDPRTLVVKVLDNNDKEKGGKVEFSAFELPGTARAIGSAPSTAAASQQ